MRVAAHEARSYYSRAESAICLDPAAWCHLAGFIWFDIHQHGNSTHQDWRIETSPQALAAYRQAIKQYASTAKFK